MKYDLPTDVSADAKRFIGSLFEPDPAKRLTATEALDSMYLGGKVSISKYKQNWLPTAALTKACCMIIHLFK